MAKQLYIHSIIVYANARALTVPTYNHQQYYLYHAYSEKSRTIYEEGVMKQEKIIVYTQLYKIIIALLLIVCLLCVPTKAHSASNAVDPAHKVLELIDGARTANNLSPYRRDPILQQAAQMKLEDMMQNNYFAHHSPTYGDIDDLLSQLGKPIRCAENIARYGSIEKAHAALMTSPAHRRNILARGFNAVGVAAAKLPSGGYMVVQVFGKV